MPERIYTSSSNGRLEPLEETLFPSEDELQALLAEHPELLDGEQIHPGDARSLDPRHPGERDCAVPRRCHPMVGRPSPHRSGCSADAGGSEEGLQLGNPALNRRTAAGICGARLGNLDARGAARRLRAPGRSAGAGCAGRDCGPAAHGGRGGCGRLLAGGLYEPFRETASALVRRRPDSRSSRSGRRIPQQADAGYRGARGRDQALPRAVRPNPGASRDRKDFGRALSQRIGTTVDARIVSRGVLRRGFTRCSSSASRYGAAIGRRHRLRHLVCSENRREMLGLGATGPRCLAAFAAWKERLGEH